MKKQKTHHAQENPPAFAYRYAADTQHGMSLRDYFAGQVIAGYYANRSCELDNVERMGVRALRAYRQADEMLKAR